MIEQNIDIHPILSNRWSLEIDGILPNSIAKVTNIVVTSNETTCKVHFYVSENEDVEILVKKWVFKRGRRGAIFKWFDRYSNEIRETHFEATPETEFTMSDLDYAKSGPVTITLGLKLHRKVKK